MKIITRLLIVVFSVVTLSACVSVDARLKKEFDKIRRGPAGSPYKTITNFSSSLQCMDAMMLQKQVKNIPVLIEAIEDKTEAVSAGTRDMLISALSEMTIRSHGIKVIAYGKDSANLISFMKSSSNNSAYKQKPLFDIHGSISQHDEDVISTGHSFGLFSRREGGGGLGDSASLSTIALDLNMLDARDMSVVPGVSASNSITILKHGKSLDADASINKFGVYFDINLSRTEGKTQALRNLVELSAVELVGKLTRVPYWRCLGAKDNKVHQASGMHLFAQPFDVRQMLASSSDNQQQILPTKIVLTKTPVKQSVQQGIKGNSGVTVIPASVSGKKVTTVPVKLQNTGLFRVKKYKSEVVSTQVISGFAPEYRDGL